MKITEFRNLIREEIRKVIAEKTDIPAGKLPQVIAKLNTNATKFGLKMSKTPGKSEAGLFKKNKVVARWLKRDGHVILYVTPEQEYMIHFVTPSALGMGADINIERGMSGNDDYSDWLTLAPWKDYFSGK